MLDDGKWCEGKFLGNNNDDCTAQQTFPIMKGNLMARNAILQQNPPVEPN